MVMIDQMLYFVFLGVIGLCVGSFLNVVIYRYPKALFADQSPFLALCRPAWSFCPSCEAKLKWYHNIPVISWLLLHGQCAACKKPIAKRYPLVELLTAIITVIMAWAFMGNLLLLVIGLVFSWILITLFFIDVDHQLLPDGLTLGLLWIGLLVNALWGLFVTPLAAITGAAVGYVLFALLNGLYKALRGRDGLGLGDAKLIAALLAWFGIAALPYLLIGSGVLALLVTLGLMIGKKHQYQQAFAFGPYLAIAGWLFLLLSHICHGLLPA